MSAEGATPFPSTAQAITMIGPRWSQLPWIEGRGGGALPDSPVKVWNGSEWVAASAPPTS